MTNKTLKKYEEEYIHIPKPKKRQVLGLTGSIIFGLLSFFNFLIIKSIYVKFNLGYIFANEEELVNYTIEIFHLVICYPIIFEYIFISLTIISFVSMFKKLKSYKKNGLINGLILGLITGLITGLICGFITGWIFGLIFGLIGGLIAWLIVGLLLENN